MSKCAAAITTPVTNASMQENSTTSMTSLVMVRTPLHKPPLSTATVGHAFSLAET
jgi:hypothetical protein